MASSHIVASQDNGSKPRRTGSIVGRRQHYPPPAALPNYVNRALPPRPDSNTSSAYDSLDEANKRPPIPKLPLPISHFQHDSLDPSPGGIINEAGLAMVHPQSITSAPIQLQPQKKSLEIAAPQPRYPGPTILDTRDQDLHIVSPVSASLSANTASKRDSYEVSPLSPAHSQHSFPFAATPEGLKRISSPTAGDLALSLSPSNTDSDAGHKTGGFVYTGTHTAHSSGDLAAARLASPHSQVQKIDGRYSDPGSPISGAVIHPPTSFPSDPDLSLSRDVDVRDAIIFAPLTPFPSQTQPFTHTQLPPRPKSPSPLLREEESPTSGGPLANGVSPGGEVRVAFAGPGATPEGFRRARANSKRSAPPPPLKLSERPIADAYVKTPFPPMPVPAAPPALQRGQSNPTHRTRMPSEDKEGIGFGGAGMMKKLNRVSSLPGFGFTKSLRRNSSMGGAEGVAVQREREKERGKERERERERERQLQKRKQSEDVKKLEKEGSASPLPKVRNFLEKARQLSMGHGLGIGMSSEEAKKERRRAEIKRQIRIGEPKS